MKKLNEANEWNFDKLIQLFKDCNSYNEDETMYITNAPKNGDEWATRTIVSKANEEIRRNSEQLAQKYLREILQKYPQLKGMTDDNAKPYELDITRLQFFLGFGTDVCSLSAIYTTNAAVYSRFKWEYGKELGFSQIDSMRNRNYILTEHFENATLLSNGKQLCIIAQYVGSFFDRYGLVFLDIDLLNKVRTELDNMKANNVQPKEHDIVYGKYESINVTKLNEDLKTFLEDLYSDDEIAEPSIYKDYKRYAIIKDDVEDYVTITKNNGDEYGWYSYEFYTDEKHEGFSSEEEALEDYEKFMEKQGIVNFEYEEQTI